MRAAAIWNHPQDRITGEGGSATCNLARYEERLLCSDAALRQQNFRKELILCRFVSA